MIRLGLVGAAGRMGCAIREAALRTTDVEVEVCVDAAENHVGGAGVWTKDLSEAVRPGRVIVDFSSPEATLRCAALCAERAVPLVSGTTGLGAQGEAAFRSTASRTAVLHASNFSVGLAVLRAALGAALAAAPPEWDVEIVERHHRLKKDSPSGTALALAADVAAARRGSAANPLRHGRSGAVGPRPAGEIGVHAVRGGTWVGDHTVLLAGTGESVELRHVAQDRDAFAEGAIAAARFVATAPPGLYTLDHVLRGPGRPSS